MELKEFIKTAISDITEAVSELQEELWNGTIVNPSLTQGENGKRKGRIQARICRKICVLLH